MGLERIRWRWLRLGRNGPLNPSLRDDMAGRSGVYAIREARTGEVLYVGESHTDRAWKTMLHHFQDPRGKFGRRREWVWHGGQDAVEVAWKRTAPSKAYDAESEWLERLKPTQNVMGFEDDEDAEEAPF